MSANDINNALSALDLSDEDFLKQPAPSFDDEPEEEPETPEVTDAPEEVEDPEEEQELPAEEDEAQPESDDAVETPEEVEGEDTPPETDDNNEEPEGEPAATDKPAEEEKPATDDKPKENEEPDYKAIHDKLFAPFKANGKDMRISSVDDAVALMQMGANYNKKMAALKPNLKLMKVLENNELLSEEKIGYLIDLSKKDPAAISKLIKESGIDPLDLDEAKEYAPGNYAVDDREIELDQVLDEIQDTPTYSKTIGLVSKKWDAPSKQAVADSPQLLKVINDHMASGIYDLISTEVERERMFGRLNGLTDIQAYQKVGDAIDARGGFNELLNPAPVAQKGQTVAPLEKPKASTSTQIEKKRAASSPKAAPPKAVKPEFNPLAMSDEEYSKAFNENLL